ATFAADHSRDALADAVRRANDAIFDRAREDPALRGMGTTLTAVALVEEDEDDVLAVVNVGDSRAYRMRDGELEQLTDDHSLVEEMVRTGRLTPDEASIHPQRHILTRALGVQPDVEVDCFGVTPFVGDRYLLASDGLMNEVADHEIASILRRHHDPDDAAHELVHLARTNGGSDNITVVVVDVVDDDDRAARASAAVAATPLAPRPVERDIAVAATPPQPEPRAPEAVESATPPARRPRRITVKAVVFVLALLLVLAGALAAVGFYARGAYYVGIDDATVVVYQGRPGGLLWFKPTVKQRTDLGEADVPPAYVDDVRAGKEESSLAAARAYVRNLRQAAATTPPAGADPGATSTTTAPPGQPGGTPTPTTASQIP
ncbi:MAG: family protein phosphatase, partial [Acidimicrobiaceae bacterium]|nr:family protein phosphatase [Acidimicrobiaceae bacterium]